MPSQTHYQERRVGDANELQAFFAIKPTRKAVVFVHGWGGDALTTWADFQTLLPECADCAGHDLFFYDYDGLKAEMIASVGLFREVLEQLGDDPLPLINPALDPSVQRSSGFAYDSIVIVAHSLGAILARWAIIDGVKSKANWPQKTKSVFFAPAHSGADVVSLASEVMSGIGLLRPFAAGAKFATPLIRQLETDSTELKRLAQEARRALKNGHQCVVPVTVFIADYERIVKNLPLDIDPPAKTIRGTTHTSICKPKPDFRAPLTAVLKAL